ncbi:hypothetical protein ACI2K4_17835 [Micromonospora sp. NPDC050397]|uniref:hypothetical protein n=1 Tax=Micromonospora sp. NPDC050397 TaxID=3364279 RepID=UPI00384D3400
MSIRRWLVAGLTGLALLAAGCEAPADDGADAVDPIRPDWQAVTLPTPEGPAGRLMLRDTIACGGNWYVVGAVGGADGSTRPAAWSSPDARSWTSLRLAPSSYYGERAILYAVGCRSDRIAVIGAKAGGAHGNPRVRTWRHAPDGSLVEVPAEFELYGGPTAVNASRMAGGPRGWLIAGGRESGAAVWRSPDATDFRLVENAPGLASDADLGTSAADALAVADGWLVGGSGRAPGRPDHDPLVWSSADGLAWRRVALPATADDEAVHRLARVGDGVLALGSRGATFGAWRWEATTSGGPAAYTGTPSDAGPAAATGTPSDGPGGGTPVAAAAGPGAWRDAGRFGVTGAGMIAGVEAATAYGDRLLAVTVAADGHRLWNTETSGRRWTPVVSPVAVPPGGDTAASIAMTANQVVMITDDGREARAWQSRFPGTS